MVVALRYPSLDDKYELPFVSTSYIAHPASVDNTGQGLAAVLIQTLRDIGVTDAVIRTALKGANYDGAFLNTSVTTLIYANWLV